MHASCGPSGYTNHFQLALGNCETEIVKRKRRPYLDRSRQWSAGVLGDRRKIHLQRSREPMQEGLNLVEAWESMEPLNK